MRAFARCVTALLLWGVDLALDRVDRVSTLDPRAVHLGELPERERRAAADGYELLSLDAVRDLHGLYELALETGDEMPSMGAPHSISFAEWRQSLLAFPDLDRAASAVVLHERAPVALALLSVELGSRRAGNEETGTARAHRRRGLATLAKLATIRWAAENGIESIITDNAEQNVAMLSINERLGYRPLISRTRWTRELG